jgi:hypothetical protein
MADRITYVGLDIHKESIVGALVVGADSFFVAVSRTAGIGASAPSGPKTGMARPPTRAQISS